MNTPFAIGIGWLAGILAAAAAAYLNGPDTNTAIVGFVVSFMVTFGLLQLDK